MSANKIDSFDAKEILLRIYDSRMIRTWYRDKPEGWRLISGLWSPLYIQLRVLSAYPDILRLIGRCMAEMIRVQVPQATQVVGVAFAGIPIAVATSLAGDIPCATTRKLPGVRSLSDFDKAIAEYGEHALVEGELRTLVAAYPDPSAWDTAFREAIRANVRRLSYVHQVLKRRATGASANLPPSGGNDVQRKSNSEQTRRRRDRNGGRRRRPASTRRIRAAADEELLAAQQRAAAMEPLDLVAVLGTTDA